MFNSQLDAELKKYKKIERIIFFLDIFIALLIIFFAQKLVKTAFGQASLWMGLTLLGIIILMKTFKLLGPKN